MARQIKLSTPRSGHNSRAVNYTSLRWRSILVIQIAAGLGTYIMAVYIKPRVAKQLAGGRASFRIVDKDLWQEAVKQFRFTFWDLGHCLQQRGRLLVGAREVDIIHHYSCRLLQNIRETRGETRCRSSENGTGIVRIYQDPSARRFFMARKKIPHPVNSVTRGAGCPSIVGMCRDTPNVEAVNEHNTTNI